MKREFKIRPAEWPAKDAEWELVFTTILDNRNSTSSVERVSLAYMNDMYRQIGEFMFSELAKVKPERKPVVGTRKAQDA